MDASALANAESWLNVFWWIKLAAAGFVALGVVFEFGGDWISRPFEKTVEEARKLEIETLRKELGEAKKEEGRLAAEAEASKAEIEKAKANAAAATERAARIEQAAAWRELGPEERAKLLEALKTTVSGGPIELSYPANDPEALFLASQIETVFNEANKAKPTWQVTIQPRQFSRLVAFGIRIFGKNPTEVASLASAFARSRIPFTSEPVPTFINDAPGHDDQRRGNARGNDLCGV
jgi:hypothetical protein